MSRRCAPSSRPSHPASPTSTDLAARRRRAWSARRSPQVLTGPLSNRGAEGPASETNAEDAVAEFRAAAADLLAADPRGIVYGRSATQLAYDFSRHLAKGWAPGRRDRRDPARPRRQRPAVGAGGRARGRDRPLDRPRPGDRRARPASVAEAITPATRLVAVTAASNLLGTKPPVRAIADAAHAVGALTYVDGVHATAHGLIDVGELGADFFVCSPYKFLGPHCALLAAAPALLETIRPTSWRRRPTTCPSGSSSARCPTRRWPA